LVIRQQARMYDVTPDHVPVVGRPSSTACGRRPWRPKTFS